MIIKKCDIETCGKQFKEGEESYKVFITSNQGGTNVYEKAEICVDCKEKFKSIGLKKTRNRKKKVVVPE